MLKNLQFRLYALMFAISVATLIAGGFGAYVLAYKSDLKQVELSLEKYIAERGKREQLLFTELHHIQMVAVEEFERFRAELSDAEVETVFDEIFLDFGDNTFRSRDNVYNGLYQDGVGHVNGVAGFVPFANDIDVERKRTLAAAYHTIARLIPLSKSKLESLWFFTEQDELLIYAPDRPGNLSFYRTEAPPELSFQDTDIARASSLKHNPQGVATCTPPTDLVYSIEGEALAAGCQIPIREEGKQLGVWGTTMMVTKTFKRAVQERPIPESRVMFMTKDGRAIAHPAFETYDQLTTAQSMTISKREQLHEIAGLLTQQETQSGVLKFNTRGGKPEIVAYHFLPFTEWFLLVKLPHSYVASNAFKSAMPVFIIGALGLAGLLGAISHYAMRNVVMPLNLLAARFRAHEASNDISPVGCDVEALALRKDEIGELASTLISYRREQEGALAHLENKVAERTAELERANEAKTIFLTTMSHELRTPLNGVLGIARLLKRSKLDQRDAEMVGIIESSASTLERQLSDLLDVSKMEAGQLEMITEDFDLVRAVESVAQLYQASANEKHLMLSTSFSATCKGVYRGDTVRVQQIVSNLLSNAIKFTDEGHVVLSVEVSAGADDLHKVTISVADTGCGIPLEAQERIFDRFQQADGRVTRRFGGSGLGLSIVRSLAMMMDGDVSVDSTPGQGSVFTCRLKLEKVAGANPDKLAVASPMPVINEENVRRQALLAEDHPVNQRIIQLLLEPAGFDVTIVGDGLQAVSAFRKQHFDVVLMDLRMPVMDGLEAIRQIRLFEKMSRHESSPTPILVMSADAKGEDADRSYRAGANGHMAKPLRPAQVLKTIGQLLEETADEVIEQAV